MVPISRRYEPGTLIIETTWVTDTGWVVVIDSLSIGEWAPEGGDSGRPQTGHESDCSLLRVAHCIDGEVDMQLECLPRFNYGAVAPAWSGGELGIAVAEGDGVQLTVNTDFELSVSGDVGPRRDPPARGRDRRSARSTGIPSWAGRGAPRRRSSGSSRPASSGASGCATATSPTTPGGYTCSARRWC